MWLSLDILFTKLFSFVVANEGEWSFFCDLDSIADS
jgi:hypothetical protein